MVKTPQSPVGGGRVGFGVADSYLSDLEGGINTIAPWRFGIGSAERGQLDSSKGMRSPERERPHPASDLVRPDPCPSLLACLLRCMFVSHDGGVMVMMVRMMMMVMMVVRMMVD